MQQFDIIENEQPELLKLDNLVSKYFDEALPTLVDILKIPSQSRVFDPNYLSNGLLFKTAQELYNFIINSNIKNSKTELCCDQGYSPFIFVEIEGSEQNNTDGTILFYGHIDKQPPLNGWELGLSAYDPKIINDKLYARGSADDHYSVFAAIIAIRTLQELNIKHPRIVMTFEADEESGSEHIEYYLAKFKQRIGQVDIVICLDSACEDFESFWTTSTLRGLVDANLTIKILEEGVHSGASGNIPTTFTIFRQLINRIEDSETGEVIQEFQVNIPGDRYLESVKATQTLSSQLSSKFPFSKNTQPVTKDALQQYLNRNWKAQLSIVGADNIPSIKQAGNVILPQTTFKVSLRLPPTKNPKEAEKSLEQFLTKNVPYNATVNITEISSGPGFNVPQNKPFLDNLINRASLSYFKKEALTLGGGGSIPLMNTLHEMYPNAQFIITGVLGPNTNAHGPNEFLHIPYTKKLISCLAYIVGGVQSYLKK